MRALLAAMLLCACGDDGSAPVDAGTDAGDGGTCRATVEDFPEPVAGECTSSIVDDTATLPAGDDGAGNVIVPGGRRLPRVGTIVELSGFPMAMIAIPGTRFVIVTDGGIGDEILTVVDVDAGTLVDQESFRRGASTPEALFLGLAISADGTRLWASGGGANRVWAFDVDPTTGQITRVPGRDLVVADTIPDGYASGIALTSDDATLVVNAMHGDQVILFDTTDGSEIRRIPLEGSMYPYDVIITPDDATAFVSVWNGGGVVPVDLAAGTAGAVIPTGKNPEGLALSPDGTTLVVASSDSDSFTLIDVASRTATETVWIAGETAPRGASPSAGTFDAAGRLYVVSAGDDAVDVFAPSGAGLGRVGRIPTMWYPTDVLVLDDGTVLVANGKHVGTGPNLTPAATDILNLVGGSLSIIPPAEITDEALAAWEIEIAANHDRASRFQEVICPEGAAYDFPVPRPGEGPSAVIEHVILVVRENKTYDAYLGALTLDDGTPHGNGDPSLTLIPTDEIEQVIPNTLELARQFAIGDNYYSLAEQSIQGHVRTTTGRTTDFVERSWLTTWGRGYWGIPPQGVTDPLGYPEEGSLFDWLAANDISLANFGEIVGARTVAPEPRYPGLVYNMGVPDAEKTTWLGGRWRDRCDIQSFSYVLLPNDHTFGLRPGRPTPRAMIADNDEAIGILIDALSHSTWWPRSVVFIIEDDPQDGGDHVDNHRSPLHVISPWVKRGYVSSVHYSEASIYRTIQLILGLDRPLNAEMENASPMYDIFTSRPDYTPYVHLPRTWPEETNPDDGSSMAAISQSWDFSVPDEQPGLSRLLWKHLRGVDPPWPIRTDVLLEALEEEEED